MDTVDNPTSSPERFHLVSLASRPLQGSIFSSGAWGGRPLGLGVGWRTFVIHRRKADSNWRLVGFSSTCSFGFVPCAAMSFCLEPSWMDGCSKHVPNRADRTFMRIRESSWTHVRVRVEVCRHLSFASPSMRCALCFVRTVSSHVSTVYDIALSPFACPGSFPFRTRILSLSNPDRFPFEPKATGGGEGEEAAPRGTEGE